jgi:hypothetical protein
MGNYAMNTIVRKQSIISNSKLLLLSRVLLLTAALGILVVSLFNSDPDKVTIGHTFAPLWDQVLIYGGTVVLIVLFSWLWPVFGGIITVLYGSQQILMDFSNVLSGHDQLAYTDVPVSVYYVLYSLLITGGLIGIIAGMRRKKTPIEDTELSYRMRKIALIITLSLAGTATVFGIVTVIITLYSSYSPDYLVASVLYLVPTSLILAWVAWMWPAQGGLLEILNGVFWLVLATIPNWELQLFIPYAILCGFLIAAGYLNIARGYLVRSKDISDETA